MEIQKMVDVGITPAFLMLLLLTSSRLAAPEEMEYKDGPSPAPSKSESDAQILCNRASKLALQALGNVSRALSDLKGRPSGNFSAELIFWISRCLDGLSLAEFKIQQAMEEGPEQVADYAYEPPNRYDAAMWVSHECEIDDPIAHKVRAAYHVVASLVDNARELCF